MTSEIRTNSLKSRAGLSTVTMTDSGPIISGVVTATSFSGDGSNLTGISGTSDNIIEGDTKLEVVDAGSQYITGEVNGSEKIRIASDGQVKLTGNNTANHMLGFGSNVGGLTIDDVGNQHTALEVQHGSNKFYQVCSSNTNNYISSYGAGRLAFEHTGTHGGTREKLTIAANGYIGVNKSSPSYPLVLNYTNNTTYSSSNFIANGLQIENDSTTDNTASGIFFTAKGSGANAGAAHINCIRTANGSGTLTIATRHNAGNHAERFRITSDGKVCINNDTASSDLHVCTAGSSEEDGTLRLGGTSVGLGFLLEYDQSSATVATITSNPNYSNTSALLKICVDGASNANQLVLKGDGNIGINRSDPDRELCVNGVAEFNSYDNTGGGGSYYTAKGFMIGNAYDAGKASSVTDDRNSIVWNERGLDIDFATSDTLRMKVNYQGDIFFNGMTSLTASSTNKGVVMEESSNNGRINLHANSSAGNAAGILFYHSGSYQGGIYYSSSSVSYNTSSDYRLKENVTAISDGITRLKTLKPYRFNFKIDPSKTVDGFFAHEVTAVPEAVQGEKDAEDMQQLDYTKLTPLLTAALQEAVTKIETLEAEVAALKGS